MVDINEERVVAGNLKLPCGDDNGTIIHGASGLILIVSTLLAVILLVWLVRELIKTWKRRRRLAEGTDDSTREGLDLSSRFVNAATTGSIPPRTIGGRVGLGTRGNNYRQQGKSFYAGNSVVDGQSRNNTMAGTSVAVGSTL